MKKRKNEAIWIEKRRYWQIKVTNEAGVRKTFCSSVGLSTRKGKLQAERKADEWLENGLVSTSNTVESAYKKYMEHIEKTCSTSRKKQLTSIGKMWLIKYLGPRKISSITEGDCEDILANAYKAGKTKSTIKAIRNCITTFLKFCRKHKLTDLHPEELQIPAGARQQPRYVLDENEIKVLFSSSKTKKGKEEFFINAYRFLLLSDLRPGELAGLKWSDITGNVCTISRSINSDNEVTKGKNENAARTIPLNKYAINVLADQRKMLKKCGIVSPFVFPSHDGGNARQENLRYYWYNYCEYNGIGLRGKNKFGHPRYITPYEFRHTCYSINKEMPETYKKMAFGHSRKFDGDKVYNHAMTGDLEQIAAYSNAAFEKILSQNPPTNPPI